VTAALVIGSVPAVLVGSLLSSRAPDKYIRPAITFVIFASGLKYAGMGTTEIGWTLCLVVAACGGYWLVRNKPWRADRKPPAVPEQQLAADILNR
jgi:putative Ca2+/H+ antiporter (TMEM165/GDT1 family)